MVGGDVHLRGAALCGDRRRRAVARLRRDGGSVLGKVLRIQVGARLGARRAVEGDLLDGEREGICRGVGGVLGVGGDPAHVDAEVDGVRHVVLAEGEPGGERLRRLPYLEIIPAADTLPIIRGGIFCDDVHISGNGGLRVDEDLVVARDGVLEHLVERHAAVARRPEGGDVEDIRALPELGGSVDALVDAGRPAALVVLRGSDVGEVEGVKLLGLRGCPRDGEGAVCVALRAVRVDNRIDEFIAARHGRRRDAVSEGEVGNGLHRDAFREIAVLRVGGGDALKGIERFSCDGGRRVCNARDDGCNVVLIGPCRGAARERSQRERRSKKQCKCLFHECLLSFRRHTCRRPPDIPSGLRSGRRACSKARS